MRVTFCKLLCTIALWLVVVSSQGQNLLDYTHSIGYVRSLIEAKEFQLAYEELHAMNREDPFVKDTVVSLLVYVCAKTNRNKEVTLLSDSLTKADGISDLVSANIIAANLGIDSFDMAEKLLANKAVESYAWAHEYKVMCMMLQHRYQQAQVYFNLHKRAFADTLLYENIFTTLKNTKKKNAALAVTLSAIIPASGKYYLSQPYDATFGLGLTSLYGLLSVRAFSMAGTSSIFAWVNATAFTTLYLGNMVGTYKATKRFNQKINITVKSEIKNRLYTLSGY
jgi:TM2 domain-containing membrane protein YozV